MERDNVSYLNNEARVWHGILGSEITVDPVPEERRFVWPLTDQEVSREELIEGVSRECYFATAVMVELHKDERADPIPLAIVRYRTPTVILKDAQDYFRLNDIELAEARKLCEQRLSQPQEAR